MRAPLLTLAALAAMLGGCRPKHANGAIPRQRFVLANVDLRSIPDTAPRGDSLRKAALKKNHVSEADLRRFVEVHGRSPEYLATVWREVSDSVQKRYERTFPSHAEGPPPGVGIPGTAVPPAVATLPGGPPHTLPAVVRKPPPVPRQPPPPVTEPPRPMVRAEVPPARRPPANPPVDARHPTTRPGQRPLAPIDTLDRRR